MNKLNNYIPVMSLKLGELKAIKNLNQNVRENFTPLFDIHRIPVVGGKRKTIDEHINNLLTCAIVMSLMLENQNMNPVIRFGYAARKIS